LEIKEKIAEKILTRDFLLIFLAQLTVSTVYCILIPTLPIYLSRIGSTEAEIGVLIGTLSLSSFVLRPFVGRALLGIWEGTFMITGTVLFTLASVGYLFAFSFWALLMVRTVQGIGAAFFYTAAVALIAHISPESRLGQSLSYFYLSFNIPLVLAPSLGMFLIKSFNFTLLFIVCTGLSSCALIITGKVGKRKSDPSEKSVIKDKSFLSRRALPPAMIAFMADIIWGALTAFFPLYAVMHGMINPGVFFAAFAIMTILGRGLGGRVQDLYKRENLILACLAVYITAMGILVLTSSPVMFVVAAGIWGIGHAFLFPALVAYTLGLTGSSRGPAMGTFTALEDLGMGLGPVIMGIIIRASSYLIMLLCLVLIGIINLSYFYFFVRKRE
jgi:predicted MFS family arabinose efflux permease